MSSEPRTILELPPITSLEDDDRIVIQKNSNTNSNTSQITVDNFRKSVVQGPFANDAAANTGGVLVGQLYYTIDGEVRVRIT